MNQDKFTKEELLQARKRNHRAIKYKNDSIWQSNQCGSFIIIGRLDSSSLYIQFTNTNAIYIKKIQPSIQEK